MRIVILKSSKYFLHRGGLAFQKFFEIVFFGSSEDEVALGKSINQSAFMLSTDPPFPYIPSQSLFIHKPKANKILLSFLYKF
jgi:hypothetical protein